MDCIYCNQSFPFYCAALLKYMTGISVLETHLKIELCHSFLCLLFQNTSVILFLSRVGKNSNNNYAFGNASSHKLSPSKCCYLQTHKINTSLKCNFTFMKWLTCIAATYIKMAQFYVMFFTYDKSLLAAEDTWAWKFIVFMTLRKN